jgi:predicted nucleic acid-binding protein
MNIVSNTSPIIFLAKIDYLEVFTACFNKVYIPEAVKI